jgi:hypothetical protein
VLSLNSHPLKTEGAARKSQGAAQTCLDGLKQGGEQGSALRHGFDDDVFVS